MHKSQIIKLLKLADRFDRSGKYRESDKITNNLTRLAQYYGNFGVSDTVNRIVPYDDTAEDVEIDQKRLDKQDRFRSPEYKEDEAFGHKDDRSKYDIRVGVTLATETMKILESLQEKITENINLNNTRKVMQILSET